MIRGKFISLRLQGGSLVYAVMISMLVTLVLGGLMLLTHYQRMLQTQVYQQELARENVFSAIELGLGTESELPTYREGTLFGSSQDSFSYQKESWGLYGIIAARATHGKSSAERMAIWGSKPEGMFENALFLADQGRVLKLVGETKLEGTCYLPQAGVTHGLVNRRSFRGKDYVNGAKRSSRGKIPNINYDAFSFLRRQLLEILPDSAATSDDWRGLELDSLTAAWDEPAVMLKFARPMVIDGTYIHGKCGIVSSNPIEISKNNDWEYVWVMAPVIRVAKGFEGKVQLFATDSVVIEPEVVLEYPSGILVSGREEDIPGEVYLHENSRVEGVLINDPGFLNRVRTAENYTYIANGAEVYGHAILTGSVEHRGTLGGTMIVDRFVLNTRSSVYVNHLMDAVISQRLLSRSFSGGLYVGDGRDFGVIEWLGEDGIERKNREVGEKRGF